MTIRASGRTRYRIVRRLGAGAHGTVWLATDRVRQRWVAIKVAPDRATAEVEHRFLQERRFRFHHPNLMSAIDTYDRRGRLGFVMAFADLGDLTTVIDANGPMTPSECAALAAHLLHGLHHLHDNGVVHRDLKPSNVLFRTRRSGPTPAIADFGSAIDLDGPRLTTTFAPVGTLGSMAPEVVVGDEATAQSDLFSLGRTLEFALTGSMRTPVDPTTVGAPLDELLTALLHRDPRERPSSASAALDLLGPDVVSPSPAPDLEAAGGDEAEPPIPPAGSPRRLLARAAAVFVVGAGVGSLLTSWAGQPSGPQPSARPVRVMAPAGSMDTNLRALVDEVVDARDAVGSKEPLSLAFAFARAVHSEDGRFAATDEVLVPATADAWDVPGLRAARSGDSTEVLSVRPSTALPTPTQYTAYLAELEPIRTAYETMRAATPAADPVQGVGAATSELRIGIVLPDRTDDRLLTTSGVVRRTEDPREELAAVVERIAADLDPANVDVIPLVDNATTPVDVLIDLRDEPTTPPSNFTPALEFVVADAPPEITIPLPYRTTLSETTGGADVPAYATASSPSWSVAGLLHRNDFRWIGDTPTVSARVADVLADAADRLLDAGAAQRITTGEPADDWLQWPDERIRLAANAGCAVTVAAETTVEARRIADWLAARRPRCNVAFVVDAAPTDRVGG